MISGSARLSTWAGPRLRPETERDEGEGWGEGINNSTPVHSTHLEGLVDHFRGLAGQEVVLRANDEVVAGDGRLLVGGGQDGDFRRRRGRGGGRLTAQHLESTLDGGSDKTPKTRNLLKLFNPGTTVYQALNARCLKILKDHWRPIPKCVFEALGTFLKVSKLHSNDFSFFLN